MAAIDGSWNRELTGSSVEEVRDSPPHPAPTPRTKSSPGLEPSRFAESAELDGFGRDWKIALTLNNLV